MQRGGTPQPVGCPFAALAGKGAPNPHLSGNNPAHSNNSHKKSSSLSLRTIILVIMIFFGAITLALYLLLPAAINSTTIISEINGDEAVSASHILSTAEKLVEQHLFHHKSEAEKHHHVPPRRQLSVRYNTEPNPYVKPLEPHFRASTAMSVKFRSLVPRKIRIWYDDGRGGVESGHLSLGQETTTNTYQGHVFFFTDFKDKKKVYGRFKMDSSKALIVVEDEKNPAPRDLKESTEKELQFMDEYYKKTGILWRHYYGPDGPRPPPSLYMWPASQVGEVHAVTTSYGYWMCKGSAEECHSLEPIHLELEVISLQPRAFVIKNFFSDFEAEEIKSYGAPRLGKSIVGDVDTGAFESDTRTSKNTWLPRKTSAVTDTLFRRAADLLQLDERILDRHAAAEDLQIVHYENGQKYDSHHDWGVNGHPESRFITLLLYLNDMASPTAGGETAFPKANNGLGIKVHPGKGSAVLFYDLLEDGNGDDLSLHAALPCVEGEKWLANFWVWDPKFREE